MLLDVLIGYPGLGLLGFQSEPCPAVVLVTVLDFPWVVWSQTLYAIRHPERHSVLVARWLIGHTEVWHLLEARRRLECPPQLLVMSHEFLELFVRLAIEREPFQVRTHYEHPVSLDPVRLYSLLLGQACGCMAQYGRHLHTVHVHAVVIPDLDEPVDGMSSVPGGVRGDLIVLSSPHFLYNEGG